MIDAFPLLRNDAESSDIAKREPFSRPHVDTLILHKGCGRDESCRQVSTTLYLGSSDSILSDKDLLRPFVLEPYSPLQLCPEPAQGRTEMRVRLLLTE